MKNYLNNLWSASESELIILLLIILIALPIAFYLFRKAINFKKQIRSRIHAHDLRESDIFIYGSAKIYVHHITQADELYILIIGICNQESVEIVLHKREIIEKLNF